jgi:hypothetical protein
VIAASGVGSAASAPVGGMGTLNVNPHGPGGTRFKWTAFSGSEACFTYYKLAYTTDGSPPSYLGGDPYLTAISDQGAASYVTSDLESGVTYTFRLQAIRVTDTGSFLVAETSTATYTAP